MKILRTLLLATLLSFFGGAAYRVYEYYPESIEHPGQFITNSLMASPLGIGCPSTWRCVQPANNTTTDEYHINQAITNFSNVMLLPGTFNLCKQFSIPNSLDIRGMTWHNDDSISAASNLALASTVWTCSDGSFSRFTAGQAFLNSTNTQNWSIQNIQFYGAFNRLGTGLQVNCVNANTTGGGVSGGFIIAHNSMQGCYRGITLDQSAGGNTQDGQIDDNNIGSNYQDGMFCFGCSDFRIHGNHFGSNGAFGRGYDINFVNSTTNQINNSRFEFSDASILVNGGSRMGITGNHFDQVSTAVVIQGSAAQPVTDVQVTGNTGVLNFSQSGLVMNQFVNGGGANTAIKIQSVMFAGNSWALFCTNCSAFSAPIMGMFGITISDTPNGTMFDSFYTNAATSRVLGRHVTWNADGFAPNNITQGPIGIGVNYIGMYNTTNTGIASDNLVGGIGSQNGEQITEDTSGAAHNIAAVTGWNDASGAGGTQYVFDAMLKTGATARNFRFYWSDGTAANNAGMIFNPSTCTYVGSSGLVGTGAIIGTPTAVLMPGSWCHVRGTITLGASASGNGSMDYDLVSPPSTLTYTGVAGANITITHPTLKICTAANGTPC